MLRKCGFFSILLYGNEIHWGVKYCSGRIPISQFRSEETNASTVADVAISCLTWQRGLKTLQQNSVAFSYANRMSFKDLNTASSEDGLSFKWDIFSYVHESITTVLSIHPLNQTPRCWNAFGKNVKNLWNNNSMWFCCEPRFIFLRADYPAEKTVFNAIHTAPNRQSWTSELSTVEAQGIHDSRDEAALTGFLSSLSDGFSSNLKIDTWLISLDESTAAENVTALCMRSVKTQMYAKSCILWRCKHSRDFPRRKAAYGKSKNEQCKNASSPSSVYLLFPLQRFMKNG